MEKVLEEKMKNLFLKNQLKKLSIDDIFNLLLIFRLIYQLIYQLIYLLQIYQLIQLCVY